MTLVGLKELPDEPHEKPGKDWGDKPGTNGRGTTSAGAMTGSFPARVVVQLAWPNFVILQIYLPRK